MRRGVHRRRNSLHGDAPAWQLRRAEGYIGTSRARRLLGEEVFDRIMGGMHYFLKRRKSLGGPHDGWVEYPEHLVDGNGHNSKES